jgi:hypothetical protein
MPAPVPTPSPDIDTSRPDHARSAEWKMALASLPFVLAAVVGGIWWLTRDGNGGGATTSVPATTSIPVPATTTVVATTSVGTDRPADLQRAIAAADKLRRSGDLRGAARELERGRSRWPKETEILTLLEQLVGEAAAAADGARSSADGVPDARTRKEYAQGLSSLGSAGRARGERQFARATDQYLTAAQYFLQSMKASTDTRLVTTTSIPVAPTTTVATTSVAPSSTVQSTIATTSIVPRMSDDEARQFLNRYAAAYAKWDLDALHDLFPKMTRTDQLVLDAERDSYRSCVHVFSNVRVSGTLAEPRIDADAVKTCTPTTRQPPRPENQHHIFDLQRQPNGSWIIVRHSR